VQLSALRRRHCVCFGVDWYVGWVQRSNVRDSAAAPHDIVLAKAADGNAYHS
jgi:hypothetical protein